MNTQIEDNVKYKISETQSLVERGGLLLIKSVVSGSLVYRGVDKRFDCKEVLEIVANNRGE